MARTPPVSRSGLHSKTARPDPETEALARIRLRRTRARAAYAPTPPLGKVARRVARKVIGESGSPLARLRDQWPDIVGEEIAALCRPEKISGTKSGRTLVLRVLPAAAPLIQHQSETIRQRVSVAAGGDILRLKLVQGALAASSHLQAAIPDRPLSPEALARLEASAENIAEPDLRAAIVALGRAVLTEKD